MNTDKIGMAIITGENKSSLLQAALFYGTRARLPIFPCDPTTQMPLEPNGSMSASTDDSQIKEWWGKHPNASIGLPTGSGLVVIDIEGKGEQEGLNLPDTFTVRAGSRLHKYYKGAANGRTNITEAVAMIGVGGYVILPPSAGYKVALDMPLVELPQNSLTRASLPPTPMSLPTLTVIPARITQETRGIETPSPSVSSTTTTTTTTIDITPIVTTEVIEGISDYSFTGLAEQINNNKSNYAYNEALRWLKWTGSRWLAVEGTEVEADIVDWATQRLMSAMKERNKVEEERFYGIRNGGSGRVLAALQKQAYIPMDRFKEQPWKLNCKNGMLDLKTGILAPHSTNATNYCLHQAPIDYDPTVDMGEWEKFIADLFPDETLARYLQVLMGYALTGSVEQQLFGLMYGTGNNGKSTLCNVIGRVIGDYSGELPTSDLAVKKGAGDNQPHLARALGKRLLFANEPPQGMVIDDSVIKSLASRDSMSVCQKYGIPFVLTPTWLLVLRCNNRPMIKAGDEGVWRRIKELPFTIQFTHPDTTLEDRLVERHGKAVLRWLAEGSKAYSLSHTLPPCLAVELANRKYRQEQDSIEGWFAERVVEKGTIATTLTDLYLDYEGWCADGGRYIQSKKALAAKLEQKGLRVVMGGGRKKRFIGISLSV